MEATEVRKLAELEDEHWWYRERRHLLKAMATSASNRGSGVGHVAIDVGAAGGGNTRILRDLGMLAVPVEYGAEGALVGRSRGLPVVRGDACRLPFGDSVAQLVVAFDVLEHLDDDVQALREMRRVLVPGGSVLIAVPADMALWSAHDDVVGHVRRYEREGLIEAVEKAGLRVTSVRSWNVLLRPVVAVRRRSSRGSDLEETGALLNLALRGVVGLERWLPWLRGRRGVSLLLVADRPGS